jgi:hypothetical protein
LKVYSFSITILNEYTFNTLKIIFSSERIFRFNQNEKIFIRAASIQIFLANGRRRQESGTSIYSDVTQVSRISMVSKVLIAEVFNFSYSKFYKVSRRQQNPTVAISPMIPVRILCLVNILLEDADYL